MTRIEYLLTLLIEECAEVQQRTTKALRFGLDEIQKDQLLTNEQRIDYELNDVATVLLLLQDHNLKLSFKPSPDKIEKINKYMELSESLGRLETL